MRALFLIILFSSSAADAAGSAGMPQLNPSSWAPQIFWLIITFTVLYIVIWKVVYPRLSDTIEQRNDHITDYLDEAKKITEEAELTKKKYLDFIEKAKKEANEILENNKSKINQDFEIKKEQLNKKLEEKLKDSEKEISNFKIKSINSIKEIASSIANDLLLNLSSSGVGADSIKKNIDQIADKKIKEIL
jgi:F-type H+-transporting ATPase subunit b